MKKYQIGEWTATVYVYEVKAETLEEAKQKVQMGEAKRLPEYDKAVDRDYLDLTGDFEPVVKKEVRL